MNRLKIFQSSLLLAVSLLIFSAPSTAETTRMIEITSTEDIFDTTQNPGCGVKLSVPEEKTERNIRIAKYYLQGYYDLSKNALEYSLDTYNCFAPIGTILGGTFDPPPAVSKPRDATKDRYAEKDFLKREVDAWLQGIPDIKLTRGSARIIAWDGGFFTTYQFAGTGKKGEPIEYWEIATVMINDDGQITHYEFWDDTAEIDKAIHVVFGKSLKQMQRLSNYSEAVHKKLSK